MRVKIIEKYKSIPQGLEFYLPDFCIITGVNGSGKSHLLEAMANQKSSQIMFADEKLTNILLVEYNGLNPQVDTASNTRSIIDFADEAWGEINPLIHDYKENHLGKKNYDNIIHDYAMPYYHGDPHRSLILKSILDKTGKNLEDITHTDVVECMNFSHGNNVLFFSRCAVIFKAYHMRWRDNKFNKFLNEEEGTGKYLVLNDRDFIKKHGPAPWDILNEILERASLSYAFLKPSSQNYDLEYTLKLIDKFTGINVPVTNLSSGEKILMSLALAIYNIQEGKRRPDILLLDEPDAPLHPQYSKIMMEMIKEIIVKRAGIKVVMTTHSPTTVAIAPDNSVYEINRDDKIPVMISPNKAVATLTEGIEYLRVSYEKRRQVFVESKYDVIYFEMLFSTLMRKHQYSYKPIFMAPHSGTSNCTDVISIVSKLRDAGNDLVWGIIDFDRVNSKKDTILVLGEDKRYAIENYLLEPLYVVLALIRYKRNTYQDFGVFTKMTYTEASELTQDECQTLIDNFLLLLEIKMNDLELVTLENGFKLNYPKELLLYNGHDYEKLIENKVINVKAISRGQGDSALKIGLADVIAEFPQFLPIEIGELFTAMNEKGSAAQH